MRNQYFYYVLNGLCVETFFSLILLFQNGPFFYKDSFYASIISVVKCLSMNIPLPDSIAFLEA